MFGYRVANSAHVMIVMSGGGMRNIKITVSSSADVPARKIEKDVQDKHNLYN